MGREKLPNFLVIGAAKAGTTTVYHWLDQHPQVYLPSVKEPGFFANDVLYAKGLPWYEHTYFEEAEGWAVRGEASPQYLASPRAPHRVAADLGADVRLVVLLRDPTLRAWSWYWHLVRNGMEDLPFAEALDREPTRLAADPTLARTGSLKFAYVSSGRYAEQVRRWQGVFGAQALLVLLHEDLRDARGAFRRICTALGVDPDVPVDTDRRYNASSLPRSRLLQRVLVDHSRVLSKPLRRVLPQRARTRMWKATRGVTGRLLEANQRPFERPPLPAEVETRLRHRFRDEVIELQDVIGRDLRAWLPPARG